MMGVAGGDWTRVFLQRAWRDGVAAAVSETGAAAAGAGGDDEFEGLMALTRRELDGICAAIEQRLARVADVIIAASAHQQITPVRAFRRIQVELTKVAGQRLPLLADTAPVLACTRAILNVYRQTGIEAVGVEPEAGAGSRLTSDAAPPRRDPPTPMERYGELREKAVPKAYAKAKFVGVRTAGDEKVCFPTWTMVRTSMGDRPIQDIRIGDYVLTRAGIKKVVKIHQHHWFGDLVRIDTMPFTKIDERITVPVPFFPMRTAESSRAMGAVAAVDGACGPLSSMSDRDAVTPKVRVMSRAKAFCLCHFFAEFHRTFVFGQSWMVGHLECTPNHPIWCVGLGFVRADALKIGDCLQTVSNKFVQVVRIGNVKRVETKHLPSRIFKRLVSFCGLRPISVPIRSINLQGDVAYGKVNAPSIKLKFLGEENTKTFKRFSDHGFGACFPPESTIASARAETRIGGWDFAKAFVAVLTDGKDWRSAALFRTIGIAWPFSALLVLSKQLVASFTFYVAPLNRLLFARPRTEIIAVGDRAADGEQFFAANTGLGDQVGTASVVANSRTECSAWDPVPTGRNGGAAAMLAWAAGLFQKSFDGHGGVLVYNLTVEDVPEFYANGILVHNCQICEDLAADAPYTIAEYIGLFPRHPRCRCRPIPWFDKRFARDRAPRLTRDHHMHGFNRWWAPDAGAGADDELTAAVDAGDQAEGASPPEFDEPPFKQLNEE
jgi:hypothetical protein